MEYMQDLVALNRKKRTGGGRRSVIFGAVMFLLCTPGLAGCQNGNSGFRKAIKAGMNGHIAKLTDEAVIRKHLEQIFKKIGAGNGLTYRIILVDDEEEVRKSIIRKIDWRAVGFTVVGDAENGEDALEKIEALEPDVVSRISGCHTWTG